LDRLVGLSASREVNTDLNMRLEFDAPLQLFRDNFSAKESISRRLIEVCEASWFEDSYRRWGCSQEQVPALRALTLLLSDLGKEEPARRLVRFARAQAPDEPFFIVQSLLEGPSADVDQFQQAVARITERSLPDVVALGVGSWRRKKYDQAILVFEQVVQRLPASAQTWANLSVNYEAAGQHTKAEEALKKAQALDPHNEFVKSVIARKLRKEAY
jgi:tetratricopeptide (TPR) repeat protein